MVLAVLGMDLGIGLKELMDEVMGFGYVVESVEASGHVVWMVWVGYTPVHRRHSHYPIHCITN